MINLHRLITNIELKYNKLLIQDKLDFMLYLHFFFKYRFFNQILPYKQKIFIISGKEKSNGNDLKLLYIGDNYSLLSLSKRIYGTKFSKENIGITYIWKINKIIHKYTSEVDALFIKTTRFYSRFLQNVGCMQIPIWVAMNLSINRSLESVFKGFKRSARDDIKKIKKIGFEWEITNSVSKFDFFYHNLCSPFIKSRHKELALPEMTDYQEMKRIFKKGILLLIKKDGKYHAGIVITYNKKSAYPLYVGIDIKSKYYRKGLSSALFYYMIIWANNNCFKKIRFGDTPSFLNGGEFQFKRKWGLCVGLSKGRVDILGLKVVNHNSNGVLDFLLHNPFLIFNKGKLKAFILVPYKPTAEELNQIQRNFFTPGISKPLIVCPKNKLKEAFENI